MTKRHSTLAAIAGLALLGTLQAEAQTYTIGDLLLNFRNTGNTSGNDLEVDLGPVSGLAGDTTPTVVASASLVTGVFGAPSGSVSIGFSAAAAISASSPIAAVGTLWLTRLDTTPGTAPTTVSGQQAQTAQSQTATRISDIGAGYAAGSSTGVANATTVQGSTSGGNSYQAQAEQSSSASGTINYDLFQNTAPAKGGVIESAQTGGANVYEALWEVPVSGSGSDTYEGYFTFQPGGEVDFTAVSATPEPSTYVLLGLTGLLGYPFRRKLRAVFA